VPVVTHNDSSHPTSSLFEVITVCFHQGIDALEVTDDGSGIPLSSRLFMARRHAMSKVTPPLLESEVIIVLLGQFIRESNCSDANQGRFSGTMVGIKGVPTSRVSSP
jgi:hypothetical protein